MKVIKNRIIPFPGFLAVNIFGFVFVRKDSWDRLSSREQTLMLRHEAVHTLQMRELGYLGFYLAYLVEWIFRLITDTRRAYRGISFEREAYLNENDPSYPSRRRPYSQWRKTI